MKVATDRINFILHHGLYNEYLDKIEKYELNRIYCRHNLQHFLDVARIAYIINLENNLGIDKDLIYASALLHDIGRWKQYEDSTPHHIASVELSLEILKEAEFNKEEIARITSAIGDHRKAQEHKDELNRIIYIADKKSRNCFNCAARESCNWKEEKKNYNIIY